jgi:hypothetical protein
MHSLAIALLVAAISTAQPILTTSLILRNGTHFDVEGPIREEHGRIIFRTSGLLYSIPLEEVDLEATRSAITRMVVARSEPDRKFVVSASERDRLLRALEQNHSGERRAEIDLTRVYEPRQSPDKGDEWSWRTSARGYEEAVRRAKEDVELLRARAEGLKNQIQQFFALGYNPKQFTYQSTELQLTADQIPAAELEVTRAERAYDQFRDDARRQGIMPGWLR